jgi:cytochrome b6
MFRVFLTGSYKAPREFNWNIGVLLLVFTFCFRSPVTCSRTINLDSGRSLSARTWRAPRRCSATKGPFGSMLGMTPYNDVRFGLLGGSIVDANALLRSYIWHCIGIPIVASS